MRNVPTFGVRPKTAAQRWVDRLLPGLLPAFPSARPTGGLRLLTEQSIRWGLHERGRVRCPMRKHKAAGAGPETKNPIFRLAKPSHQPW